MIVRFVKTVESFADLHRRLGEVPGFKLPLADLFAATKRRKKKSR